MIDSVFHHHKVTLAALQFIFNAGLRSARANVLNNSLLFCVSFLLIYHGSCTFEYMSLNGMVDLHNEREKNGLLTICPDSAPDFQLLGIERGFGMFPKMLIPLAWAAKIVPALVSRYQSIPREHKTRG